MTRRRSRPHSPTGHGTRWLAMFAVLTWARHREWPALGLPGATIAAGEAAWRSWVREVDLDLLEAARAQLAPTTDVDEVRCGGQGACSRLEESSALPSPAGSGSPGASRDEV